MRLEPVLMNAKSVQKDTIATVLKTLLILPILQQLTLAQRFLKCVLIVMNSSATVLPGPPYPYCAQLEDSVTQHSLRWFLSMIASIVPRAVSVVANSELLPEIAQLVTSATLEQHCRKIPQSYALLVITVQLEHLYLSAAMKAGTSQTLELRVTRTVDLAKQASTALKMILCRGLVQWVTSVMQLRLIQHHADRASTSQKRRRPRLRTASSAQKVTSVTLTPSATTISGPALLVTTATRKP